ncbi:MAG: hypothetical protein M3O62_04915 [Pseudomonadota bacterium]|nr:hypothetical protein [Pseudomonadota bacterium]
MKLRALILLLGVAACTPAASGYPEDVDAYLKTLSAVEKAKAPMSLEPLFAAAGAAQDALMAIQGDGDQAWQETLSDTDYAKLRKQLRGVHLSRGHDVYAQPDGQFLSKLAQAHGRAEDRAFFALYEKLWTAEMLPQYLNLGTGQAPCVRFGDDIVGPLYSEWSQYASAHPQAYTAFAMQTLRDLEEVVELGTCACGAVDSVKRELSAFIDQFPKSAAQPKVQLRLDELNRDDVDHFVHCR